MDKLLTFFAHKFAGISSDDPKSIEVRNAVDSLHERVVFEGYMPSRLFVLAQKAPESLSNIPMVVLNQCDWETAYGPKSKTALHVLAGDQNGSRIKQLNLPPRAWNLVDDYGYRPMDLAAKSGSLGHLVDHPDFLRLYLQPNHAGTSPLHLSFQNLTFLKVSEDRLDSQWAALADEQGMNPIHHAAANGNLRFIPESWKTKDLFAIEDNSGRTAYHHAAKDGRIAEIRSELLTSEEMNKPDAEGYTPILLAATRSDFNPVRRFFTEKSVTSRAANGDFTLLHIFKSQQTALLEPEFLKKEHLARIGPDGSNCLHKAMQRLFLIQKVPKEEIHTSDLELEDAEGNNAFHLGAQNGTLIALDSKHLTARTLSRGPANHSPLAIALTTIGLFPKGCGADLLAKLKAAKHPSLSPNHPALRKILSEHETGREILESWKIHHSERVRKLAKIAKGFERGKDLQR